jgi:hypothetical protein
LFPVVLDDLIPANHVCGVIDAFMNRISMGELGFDRAEAADTGRPDTTRAIFKGFICMATSMRFVLRGVWSLSAAEVSSWCGFLDAYMLSTPAPSWSCEFDSPFVQNVLEGR